MKFNSIEDAELFCIDEGLITIEETGTYSMEELVQVAESIGEEAESKRDEMRGRMIDRTKSREAKRNWKHKKQRYINAIHRFHKSVKGNRVHQKIAKARRDGELGSIHEEMTTLNSVITRLAINAGYSSSLSDEANRVALLQEGVEILTPVLHDMIYEGIRLNDRLNLDESGEFIDDLFSLGDEEDYDNEDEEVDDESENPGVLTGQDFEDDEDAVAKSLSRQVDLTYESDEINESLSDSFTVINEDSGDPDVDGVHVIGKVVGPAFFPDTVSRNQVHYTKELWDHVLADTRLRQELDARRVYGTFGHSVKIDDDSLREGKISHIIKDIYYNEDGKGWGEYLILNTETGRNLKTYLGAGSKIRVSTRCSGKFMTNNRSRYKMPDPKWFRFEGIDFVHDPGYLNAEPKLINR